MLLINLLSPISQTNHNTTTSCTITPPNNNNQNNIVLTTTTINTTTAVATEAAVALEAAILVEREDINKELDRTQPKTEPHSSSFSSSCCSYLTSTTTTASTFVKTTTPPTETSTLATFDSQIQIDTKQINKTQQQNYNYKQLIKTATLVKSNNNHINNICLTSFIKSTATIFNDHHYITHHQNNHHHQQNKQPKVHRFKEVKEKDTPNSDKLQQPLLKYLQDFKQQKQQDNNQQQQNYNNSNNSKNNNNIKFILKSAKVYYQPSIVIVESKSIILSKPLICKSALVLYELQQQDQTTAMVAQHIKVVSPPPSPRVLFASLEQLNQKDNNHNNNINIIHKSKSFTTKDNNINNSNSTSQISQNGQNGQQQEPCKQFEKNIWRPTMCSFCFNTKDKHVETLKNNNILTTPPSNSSNSSNYITPPSNLLHHKRKPSKALVEEIIEIASQDIPTPQQFIELVPKITVIAQPTEIQPIPSSQSAIKLIVSSSNQTTPIQQQPLINHQIPSTKSKRSSVSIVISTSTSSSSLINNEESSQVVGVTTSSSRSSTSFLAKETSTDSLLSTTTISTTTTSSTIDDESNTGSSNNGGTDQVVELDGASEIMVKTATGASGAATDTKEFVAEQTSNTTQIPTLQIPSSTSSPSLTSKTTTTTTTTSTTTRLPKSDTPLLPLVLKTTAINNNKSNDPIDDVFIDPFADFEELSDLPAASSSKQMTTTHTTHTTIDNGKQMETSSSTTTTILCSPRKLDTTTTTHTSTTTTAASPKSTTNTASSLLANRKLSPTPTKRFAIRMDQYKESDDQWDQGIDLSSFLKQKNRVRDLSYTNNKIMEISSVKEEAQRQSVDFGGGIHPSAFDAFKDILQAKETQIKRAIKSKKIDENESNMLIDQLDQVKDLLDKLLLINQTKSIESSSQSSQPSNQPIKQDIVKCIN